MVATSSRDEMDVAVHDGLARRLAAVDADVESLDRGIGREQRIARHSEQALAGARLRSSKVEVVSDVPQGDDEAMPGRHREAVLHDNGQRVLHHQPVRLDRAERASLC